MKSTLGDISPQKNLETILSTSAQRALWSIKHAITYEGMPCVIVLTKTSLLVREAFSFDPLSFFQTSSLTKLKFWLINDGGHTQYLSNWTSKSYLSLWRQFCSALRLTKSPDFSILITCPEAFIGGKNVFPHFSE